MISTPSAASLSIKEAADFLWIHPVTMQALAHFHRLREMNQLLAVYFLTEKRKTEATVSRLRDLVGEIETSPAAHLAWR